MTEIWRLQQPLALLLWVALPWLYWRIVRGWRLALPFGGPVLREHAPTRALLHLQALLVCAGLAFLIWGLARPQGGTRRTVRKTDGIDIIVAVDTSGSMAAMDFTLKSRPASRLDAAQDVFRRFIALREGDRIGIVSFGELAFTQAPLTTDLGALQDAVRGWEVGMAGANKTAVGDALAVATNRLKDLEAKSKVVILLTDGKSNAGSIDPLEAAKAAKALDVRVYTIGIGTDGTAPVPATGPFGGSRMVRRRVEFDEATLQSIADITEAAYFRASDTGTLQEVIDTIDRLEKTQAKIEDISRYHERFSPWVGWGLLLLMGAMGLALGGGEAGP